LLLLDKLGGLTYALRPRSAATTPVLVVPARNISGVAVAVFRFSKNRVRLAPNQTWFGERQGQTERQKNIRIVAVGISSDG